MIGFPTQPMRAVLGSLPGDDEHWAYEIKFDGYRTLAFVDGGRVRLQSSNSIDVTHKYPELRALAGSVNSDEAVLDGELVVLDDVGRPRFELIQRHGIGDRQAAFYAFDVLQLNRHETIGLPYEQRRALLAELVEPGQNWAVPSHRIGGGAELYASTLERGLEGVMAKRLGTTYTPGKRTPHWRKVKHRRRDVVVIGGWSDGTGSRSSSFGALLVGVPTDDGRLRFGGGVGTGFDAALLDLLSRRLAELASDHCPFSPAPPR